MANPVGVDEGREVLANNDFSDESGKGNKRFPGWYAKPASKTSWHVDGATIVSTGPNGDQELYGPYGEDYEYRPQPGTVMTARASVEGGTMSLDIRKGRSGNPIDADSSFGGTLAVTAEVPDDYNGKTPYYVRIGFPPGDPLGNTPQGRASDVSLRAIEPGGGDGDDEGQGDVTYSEPDEKLVNRDFSDDNGEVDPERFDGWRITPPGSGGGWTVDDGKLRSLPTGDGLGNDPTPMLIGPYGDEHEYHPIPGTRIAATATIERGGPVTLGIRKGLDSNDLDTDTSAANPKVSTEVPADYDPETDDPYYVTAIFPLPDPLGNTPMTVLSDISLLASEPIPEDDGSDEGGDDNNDDDDDSGGDGGGGTDDDSDSDSDDDDRGQDGGGDDDQPDDDDDSQGDPFDGYAELAKALAPQVAAFIGRRDHDPTIAQAEASVPVVAAFVNGYVRGHGVSNNGRTFDPQLQFVVISSAARLVNNPEQVTSYSTLDYSERPAVLDGFTLAERGVLHNYRRRWA